MTMFTLIGFVPFDDHPFGFAQAIFEAPSGDLFVQVGGRLSEPPMMKRISSEIDFVYANVGISTDGRGGENIFVFLDGKASIHAGTVRDLSSVLIKSMNNRKCPASVRLQIADLIGNSDQRRLLNLILMQEIREKNGSDAAKMFYESSVLFDTFWRIVSNYIIDDNATLQIKGIYRRLTSNLRLSEELLPDSDWKMLAPHLSKRPSVIRQLVLAEVPLIAPAALEGARTSGQNEVEALVLQLQNNSRQEKRIASLLKAFVDNRENGVFLYNSIKPRSKFEISAFRYIYRLFEAPLYLDINEEELAISFASKFYGLKSCRRRAYFLRYLAEYLGNYNKMAVFVNDTIEKSRSREVLDMRSEILEILSRHKQVSE